MKGSDRAS
jgi:hypothetical protein